jgi:predicted glycogen debranching enzyme
VNVPLAVDFGSEVCCSLEVASEREWLVTNGLGGYASGTVAGAVTRRYHGLLVAALRPPAGRTLLVSKFDEIFRYDGRDYALGANRWADGSVSPEGFRLIERFHLAGTTPVWTFACADALVEKRVWMQEGANTTFVRYDLVRSSAGAAELEVKALVNYRDFHGITSAGDWRMDVVPVQKGLGVLARPDATEFYLLSNSADAEPRQEWYRNFDLAAERCRGLGDREDHFLAGVFRAKLAPGKPVTFVLSTDAGAPLDGGAALDARAALEEKSLELWVAAQPQAALEAPPWIRQLVLAAAQFRVARPAEDEPDALTILAGYHWFGEWSRDTLIALPGLALGTGRADLARSILHGIARFVDQGMLPNDFPESGQSPEYNSVDAALWYFEALRQYHAETSDLKLIEELFAVLTAIVDWHVHGTRSGIRMDEADGLLHAGEPGVQLTWMDAKVGHRVITPRAGKPVEINALWYNALRTMARFAFALNKSPDDYVALAERVQKGFARFWNEKARACFDVIDGPDGNDASLRPNQIFAVSLPESPLSAEQRAAVVDLCARRLVTRHGLRTLDPGDPRYCGHYGGPPAERDAAYHQGTVWAWLLGPFVLAHLRVYRDAASAFTFLEPMAHHLAGQGAGTVGEIFDGDPPHAPRGAIAQAWSVGEILRAWRACQEIGRAAAPAPPGSQLVSRF